MEIKINIPDNYRHDYMGDKFKDFFSRVMVDIDNKGMCGNYEKEIAEMFIKAFDKSTETNNICNCKHNHNSNSDEPCCRCDSRVLENDNTINKVTSLEIIVRMVDSKPYYEIKYKKVGEDYYHVGYSSYNLNNVLKWYGECFELVNEKTTNADRIRSMSDEELLDLLCSIETYEQGSAITIKGGIAMCSVSEVEKWLQSPVSEVSDTENLEARR